MKMKNVLLVAILFSHSLLAMEDSIVLEESTIDQKLLELLMQKDASLVNVEELIQKGANVNVIGQGYFSEATPLVLAGLQSNIEICELLIERGAEVQVTVDENNATLLHFAATENNTPMCSLFLEKGVEVVAKDKNGCTPLMYAAMKGHKNICSLLIDHKSNVNAVDNNKLCPLLHAMSGNHLELCSYLIDNGANVNGTYQNNLTPLMFAVMSGQTDLCELLIENGAELRDFPKGLLLTLKYFEWPLLTVAAHNGYVDICSLLECSPKSRPKS